jgi:putative ABC transport system ATP-binding protein
LEIPDLIVNEGEFVAVMGESGCGKSTLLDTLGLVLKPASAELFILHIPRRNRDYVIPELSDAMLAKLRKKDLGYVLQTGGLLPFLTVRRNIQLPCQLNGLSETEKCVENLAAKLGIAEQLAKKPQALSCGERQRASIARALAHQPAIVLADEPTGAVDKVRGIQILKVFVELVRQIATTLIVVTHDTGLVGELADRMFTFEVDRVNEQLTKSICREVKAS